MKRSWFLALLSLLLVASVAVQVCAQNSTATNTTSTTTTTTGTDVPQTDDQKEEQEAEQVAEHPFLEVYGLLNGSWAKFFVIVVAASRLALVFPRIGLPLITGYMIIGCLCGPYVLGLVTKPQIPDLSYVTQTALAFIAFSAGSELYLPELRSLFRTIILITGFNALFSYIFCTIFIYLIAAAGVVPWMTPYMGSCAFSISLVAGSIMVARSPASAIAVVRELKAKGPATSIMLGVTVVGDVVVLVLFTLSNSFALAMCGGGGFDGGAFLITLLTLVCAVGLGYGLGFFLIFLLWIPRVPAKFTIIPLGFLIFVLCDWIVVWTEHHWGVGLNFDALLICITAGYVVTNKSQNRIAFLKMLGGAGAFIFIPFFTLVGVQLNLTILVQSIGFGVLVFIMRALCIVAGSFTGSRLAGLDKEKQMKLWMTMLAQAGVSLGLAAEVAVKFPEWGSKFQTTIISVVLINQFAGPVLCKYALKAFGEAGKMVDGEDEHGHGHDEHAVKKLKRAVIVGIDSVTLGVAAKLLKAGWRVSLMDKKRANLILAKSLGIAKKDIRSTIDGDVSGSDLSSASATTAGATADDNEALALVSGHAVDSSAIDIGATAATATKEPLLDLFIVSASKQLAPATAYSDALLDKDCLPDAVVVGLENDQTTYEVGAYFSRAKHAPRVLCRAQNAAWLDVYKTAGLLPISHHSLSTQSIFASVTSRGNFQVVSPTMPLQEALLSMIDPVEDNNFTQLPMSGEQRVEWEDAHPPPTQEVVSEIALHLDKAGVDSESIRLLSTVAHAHREDYLDKLHNMHSMDKFEGQLSQQELNAHDSMYMGVAGHAEKANQEKESRRAAAQEAEAAETRQVESALEQGRQ